MCGSVGDVQATSDFISALRVKRKELRTIQPPELRRASFVYPAWHACASAPNQSPNTRLAEHSFLNSTPTVQVLSAPDVHGRPTASPRNSLILDRLVITVDNGISALEPVRLADRLGLDVTIIDHHQRQEQTPAAAAIPREPRYCASGLAMMTALVRPSPTLQP
jgi:DHH family